MYLTQGLHRAVQRHPDKISSWDQGKPQTYVELLASVVSLAAMLQELGVKEGDRVAMLSQNSAQYLVYYLATWWSGGVANPVNTRWSASEIAYSLNDSETRLMLVDDAFLQTARDVKAMSSALETVVHIGSSATPEGFLRSRQFDGKESGREDACRGGDDLAAIFYTGGTTGAPKGVMLSHANLWSSAISRMAAIHSCPDSVILHIAPLFHLGAAGRLFGQIMLGGTHVFLPAFRPAEVIDSIDRYQVTEAMLVPSMLQMLLEHPTFASDKLKSLQRISYGASPISEALLDRTIALLPHVEFAQSYGLTETASVIAINPPENHTGAGRARGLLRAAGRATLCAEVKIADAQGKEVRRGALGEVCVRGPSVMLGYWKKPEATADAIRDGWLRTGDGGRMDEEGYIYIADRLKDMIISGGENVYSAEVENAIARHPAVAACAVIGIPHELWGESVHAVVVPHPGAALTLEELQLHCKALIAGYKCPKSLELREALPMSAVGKIMKNVLRQAWRPAPERQAN